MFENPKARKQITEEISDVLFFIFRLSQKYNIDLTTEFRKKMEKNEQKYQMDKFKGSNKRYSEI
jgi:NTP pyrophosphatase (non-canonical NTP hydrolase)